MGVLAGLTCFCLALVFVTGDHSRDVGKVIKREHFLIPPTEASSRKLEAIPVEKTESDLRHALFEHYDHLVRPVKHVKEAIPAVVSLIPVAIKDVDVKHQAIDLDAWLYLRWEDDYLHWEPSEYGGLESLRLPCSEVWTPDFTIYYPTSDSHHLPSVHTNVIIYHNGTVLWVPPLSVQSRCVPPAHEDDKEHFHCTIQAGSWTYDVSLLDIHELHANLMDISRDSFQDTNADWTLESMTASAEKKLYSCCTEEYSLVKFQFVFKKKHNEHKDGHHDDHKDDHHDEHKDGHHDDHKDEHHDDHKVGHHDDHKDGHKDGHHDDHKDDHHDEHKDGHHDDHKGDHHDEHKDDHHDEHKEDHHDDHKDDHKDSHHATDHPVTLSHADDHAEDNQITPADDHH